MKMIRYISILLLPVMFFFSCLKDEKIKLEYNGFRPVEINDDWTISNTSAENIDSSILDKAYRLVYNDDRFIMAASLLVIRNGKLVAEAYPRDPGDIDRIQNIQSCTKSFTSVLTGIALSQGLIDSVHQSFADIYPQHFQNYPEMEDITIYDALTMQTGIDFNNNENTLGLYQEEGSSVEYVLSLPKIHPAGVVFNYHDGAPQLVSAAIQEKYGKTFAEFADENLFKPLNIIDWKWESAKDGVTFGAFSLYLTPRDCSKFGQMLLDHGRWNGQQIVDSTWILEAMTPQATSQTGASYGYYFWLFPEYPGYAAEGHGGQYIFICPEQDLVIVYTAWPYVSGDLFDNFHEVAALIISSCN